MICKRKVKMLMGIIYFIITFFVRFRPRSVSDTPHTNVCECSCVCGQGNCRTAPHSEQAATQHDSIKYVSEMIFGSMRSHALCALLVVASMSSPNMCVCVGACDHIPQHNTTSTQNGHNSYCFTCFIKTTNCYWIYLYVQQCDFGVYHFRGARDRCFLGRTKYIDIFLPFSLSLYLSMRRGTYDFLVFYCPKMRMNLINWPTLWDDLTTNGILYYFHLFLAHKLHQLQRLVAVKTNDKRKRNWLFIYSRTECVQLFHTIRPPLHRYSMQPHNRVCVCVSNRKDIWWNRCAHTLNYFY